MAAVNPEESKSLPVHVGACAERYKTLFSGLEDVREDVRQIKRTGFRILLGIIVKLLAVLGVLIALLWQGRDAKADEICADREALVEALVREHSERRVAGGLAANGNLVELWTGPSGGWTLMMSTPDGWACLIAAGDAWEPQPKPKPEERES